MVSRNDLLVGVLVLIGGLIMYSGAPGGVLFVPPSPGPPPDPTPHSNSMYTGGALAIIFGLVGLALMKKTNRLTWAVAVLSILLGIVFALDAPGSPLYTSLVPHGQAMQAIGGLAALVGIIGVIGAVAWKKM